VASGSRPPRKARKKRPSEHRQATARCGPRPSK
jgi:hypothetical protein